MQSSSRGRPPQRRFWARFRRLQPAFSRTYARPRGLSDGSAVRLTGTVRGGENRRMAKVALVWSVAMALVLLTGCGSSQNSQDQQWFGEVVDVTRQADTRSQRDESLAKIHAALESRNPDQLAAAFATYAEFLGHLGQRFADTNPPDQCRGASESLVGSVEQLRSRVQQLSVPSAVDTRAELLQAVADLQRIQSEFEAHLRQIADQKHC